MATSRLALGSMLDTVTKAASTVSSVFDATTKGIGMVDRLVSKAATEQELKHRAAKRTFVKNLVRTSAEEESQADIRVLEFCAQSPQHKHQFEKNYDEFAELFAEELGLDLKQFDKSSPANTGNDAVQTSGSGDNSSVTFSTSTPEAQQA